MPARNRETRPYTAPQARTVGLRFPNWTRFSTTVAVFPLDAHLPSGLRRKMDERCLIGNDVGSVGLVAAGGQGRDASVVHAGACCRVGACVPRWPAGAGAA